MLRQQKSASNSQRHWLSLWRDRDEAGTEHATSGPATNQRITSTSLVSDNGQASMRALAYLVPLTSITVLTVIAALPWGLPTEERFFLPMLPVVAIHYWASRRPDAVPEWAIFIVGLLLDVFTHGPLGYWVLIYLTAYALGVLGQDIVRRGRLQRLASFLLTLALVAGVGWAVASAYFLELADWQPYARGASFAAIAAIVIIPILHLFNASNGPREDMTLTRGG